MTRKTIATFLAVASAAAALADRAAYTPVAPATAISADATGFFRAERIDGRDWIVDPVGRAVLVLSVDHVRPFAWKDRNLGYDVYRRFVETNYPSKGIWVDETLGRLRSWGFNTLANDSKEPLLRNRGMALDVSGGSGADGANVQLWQENGTAAQ